MFDLSSHQLITACAAAVAFVAISARLYPRLSLSGPLTKTGEGNGERHGSRQHYTTWKAAELFLNPPNTDIQALLLSRSIPNQRLVRAFGLNNTFVSADPHIHSQFRSRAVKIMNSVTSWSTLFDIASEAAETSLPAAPHSSSPYDIFIQDITIRVVLIGLLGVDRNPEDLDPISVRAVGTLISQLWTLSKTVHEPDQALKDQLRFHLARLFGDQSEFDNPLDFLIPTWETLWRVVATTLAYTHRNVQYRSAFSRLAEERSMKQFRTAEDGTPSAQSVITEVLRLHPPSRRIHRAVPSGYLPGFLEWVIGRHYRPEVADIEAVHHSQDIWGPTSNVFDPMRHEGLEMTEDRRTLAFGAGRLQCIAKNWAPMAAGIIVAAILDKLHPDVDTGFESEFRVIEGDCLGGRDGWEGWSVVRL
ncbi:hypothetical protein VNI00_009741 [Paramarasmius palmivorus]|uniref:Cytochrome P450 n=1 Tax=Paramarasmius palmivorus TaxID=297713 RepID=A0AAW0CKW8_9AGAR